MEIWIVIAAKLHITSQCIFQRYQTGFFMCNPLDTIFNAFAYQNRAAWKMPLAFAGINSPFDQKQAVILYEQ